jgi:hypothetical protein
MEKIVCSPLPYLLKLLNSKGYASMEKVCQILTNLKCDAMNDSLVAIIKVLPGLLPEGTEKILSGQPLSQLKYERTVSQIQVKNSVSSPSCSVSFEFIYTHTHRL